MSMNLVVLLYLVASVCFIQALKGLSHPKTSILGNAFGMGGIGALLIGWLADLSGIAWAFQLSALLPAIGLLVVFLPNLDHKAA